MAVLFLGTGGVSSRMVLSGSQYTKFNTVGLFLCLLFRVDIPVQALNLYFNGAPQVSLFDTQTMIDDLLVVTHPVVSQVNPHVHLFFFAPRGSAGKPVAHRKGKGTPPVVPLGSP